MINIFYESSKEVSNISLLLDISIQNKSVLGLGPDSWYGPGASSGSVTFSVRFSSAAPGHASIMSRRPGHTGLAMNQCMCGAA